MSLKRLNFEKNAGFLLFKNPPFPNISLFSLGQKECAYFGKFAYFG